MLKYVPSLVSTPPPQKKHTRTNEPKGDKKSHFSYHIMATKSMKRPVFSNVRNHPLGGLRSWRLSWLPWRQHVNQWISCAFGWLYLRKKRNKQRGMRWWDDESTEVGWILFCCEKTYPQGLHSLQGWIYRAGMEGIIEWRVVSISVSCTEGICIHVHLAVL